MPSKQNLFRVERLGHALRRAATNAAQSGHRKKRIVTEPAPFGLAGEMPPNYFNLPTDLA